MKRHERSNRKHKRSTNESIYTIGSTHEAIYRIGSTNEAIYTIGSTNEAIIGSKEITLFVFESNRMMIHTHTHTHTHSGARMHV